MRIKICKTYILSSSRLLVCVANPLGLRVGPLLPIHRSCSIAQGQSRQGALTLGAIMMDCLNSVRCRVDLCTADCCCSPYSTSFAFRSMCSPLRSKDLIVKWAVNLGEKKHRFLTDLGLDKWPLWAVFALSLGAGLLAALITRFFIVGRLKSYILGGHGNKHTNNTFVGHFTAHTINNADEQQQNGLKDVKSESNGVSKYRRVSVNGSGIEQQQQNGGQQLLANDSERESTPQRDSVGHQQNGSVGNAKPPFNAKTPI